MRNILSHFILVVLGVGAVAAWSANDEKKVLISPRGFSPEKVELKVGDKVTWTNATETDHRVTSRAIVDSQEKQTFDSGSIRPQASWSLVFDKPGTYEYQSPGEAAFQGTLIVTK